MVCIFHSKSSNGDEGCVSGKTYFDFANSLRLSCPLRVLIDAFKSLDFFFSLSIFVSGINV